MATPSFLKRVLSVSNERFSLLRTVSEFLALTPSIILALSALKQRSSCFAWALISVSLRSVASAMYAFPAFTSSSSRTLRSDNLFFTSSERRLLYASTSIATTRVSVSSEFKVCCKDEISSLIFVTSLLAALHFCAKYSSASAFFAAAYRSASSIILPAFALS